MAKKNKTYLFIPDGFSGKIRKQLVVRQYTARPVIAKYPRSKKNRAFTDLKKLYEERFCSAIEQKHHGAAERKTSGSGISLKFQKQQNPD